MFEFRPGEFFTISPFDAKPENVPRNMLFLVRIYKTDLPEGLIFSKEEDKKPTQFGIQMMCELDDGWAWDWPNHYAREDIGGSFMKIIEEYGEEGIVGKWCWMKITIDDTHCRASEKVKA